MLDTTRLDSAFTLHRERLRLPGLAIAVVQDGRVAWSKGYGMADVERRIPITPETPFNIASLTKPMAATLLMRLVERQRLSLDEPMSSFTTRFSGDTVRVRHVLSMTADSRPPGTRYSYNGDLYTAIGAVLARKTGRPFRELLVDSILDPLGMRRTSPGTDVVDSAAQLLPVFGAERTERYRAVLGDLAISYRLYGGTELMPSLPPNPALSTSADVVSTVLDYARFTDALSNG